MTSFCKAFIQNLQKIIPDSQHKELFTLQFNELIIDLSRHYLKYSEFSALITWLETTAFTLQKNSLFSNNCLNFTEQRAVNHVLLRDPTHNNAQQNAFTEAFTKGQITGLNGLAITDFLTIGIGGSHLGSELVTTALTEFCRSDIHQHYLTGTDPYALADLLAILPVATTLVFVVSKSWSTLETLWNFDKIQAHFLSQLGQEVYQKCFKQQFFAITANKTKAITAGFNVDHIFHIDDSIGGRFSLWSAVGLPMRLSLGETHYSALLKGAHAMDEHFKESPLINNLPVLLSIIDLYYANCLNVQQRAVIPYTKRLSLFVNHLQQLEMESNGKSINQAGERIHIKTGLAVWGGIGPDSQHSFHQWFYQGTMVVPLDFVVLKGQSDFEQLLLSQCLAQAQSLWQGAINADPHKNIKGGTPSTMILLKNLNPYTLGQLITLYEHKVFVNGLLTDTNPFDQFGVEAGKIQGITMLAAITDSLTKADLDPVTQNILKNLC